MPCEVREFVEECTTNRETGLRRTAKAHRIEQSRAVRRYLAGKYEHNRLTLSRAGGSTKEHQGYALIIRCRLGAIATAVDLAKWGYINARYKVRCPFCNKRCGGESIYHMVIKCKAWRTPRRALIKGTLRHIRRSLLRQVGDDLQGNARRTQQTTLYWLLGGSCRDVRVRNWYPGRPDEIEEPDIESDSDSDQDPEEPDGEASIRRENEPASQGLARFLVIVMRNRAQKIRQLTGDRVINLQDIVPAPTAGQRPDG